MLEIHPLTDEEERRAFCAERGLPPGAAVLCALENGGETGHAAMTIEGCGEDAVLTMHAWDYSEDDFTGELLLRAVISYAFNRAVPTVSAPLSLRNALTDKVGFETREDGLWISTKNVVHFCQK